MNQGESRPVDDDPVGFLAGGGELGRSIREFDWSKTPVGPVANWPHSLKVTVRIMIDSRYAMWLGWGPDFTFFYNDAYARMTLGPKHPWALGRSAREVWSEIWADIGPRAELVISTGQATWDEGLLLFLERNGFPEETYHTFSYSPVPDDLGGIGGMLCVVTEDTVRTIGERRLRTLRELATRMTVELMSAEDACQSAVQTLADNPYDLPFVLIYLLDNEGKTARLHGVTGLPKGTPAAPSSVDLTTTIADGDGWPLQIVLTTGRAEVVTELERRFGQLSGQPWSESPQRAVVVPMAKPGQLTPTGFVIAGVSPRLAFSDDYKGFLELLAGYVGTAVSNARTYEEERRRAEQLAELDRAKTAFFSNVSHEFRTPLALMLGPVEDLLSHSHTDLPPAAAGQLEVVNRNGLRLLRLVNSLLDFSRIEAGRVQAVYRPTELATFTADLASNFRSACERAGLRLAVDCPPLGESVFVDRDMWEKIVLNLISNAFKFTFEGQIAVSLRRKGTAAELQISDTGTGVSAKEIPRLFERFHRVENARSRTHEGSGIGLALVYELVKLHGGSVTAESVLGEGTTFTVRVPLGSAHLPPDQIGNGRSTVPMSTGATPYVEEALRWLPGEGRDDIRKELPKYHEALPTPHHHAETDLEDDRPRVLVADDNADMRQYIVRLLAEQFRVEAVSDGEAALAVARDCPPELVLTDVMMPKLNGFGLLKELRANPDTSGLPVILLSARAGEESRVEGVQAGADDYLVKPFSARELLARVTAHVQMSRLRRESSRAVRESEERLHALVSATSDVVYRMSADWTEMRRLDGREFIADTHKPRRSWLEMYIPAQDQPHVIEVIQTAVRTKSIFELEHRVLRVDGTLGWTFSRAIPLMDENGEVVEWFGMASDVTARKQAEEQLQQERDRLRVTLASIGDAVITTDTEGHVTFLNGVAESLTGWTNADAVGQRLDDVFKIVNEARRQSVENPATRSLREGLVVGLANHTVLIRKDGTELPIDDSAAPVRDGESNVVGCILVFRDISERRAAELAQTERSRLSSLRADIAAALAADSDLQTNLRQCAEALVRHLDVAFAGVWTFNGQDDVLELQASSGDYADLDGPHIRMKLGEYEIGRIAQSRHPHVTNDVPNDPNVGGEEWRRREGIVSFAGFPLLFKDQVVGVMAMFARKPLTEAVLTDLNSLTEGIAQYLNRKRAEEEVARLTATSERQRRLYETILSNTLDFVYMFDLNHYFTYANQALLTMWGKTWDEAIGKNCLELGYEPWHAEMHDREIELIKSTKQPIRGEVPFTGTHGRRIYDYIFVPVIGANGEVEAVAGATRDVTDRKGLEDELRRLAAELSDANRKKDEFLATLAHELRNPLAPLRNGLQILKMSDMQDVREQARTLMERQLEQMVRLVDDLMDVSRITRGKVELRKVPFELAAVVSSAVETIRPLVNDMGHKLTVDLPKERIGVNVDPTRLAQVFANLLNNAAKYTDPGGHISVFAERLGGDVEVVVKDTGIGIPADMLESIFDMFLQVDRSLEKAQGGLGIGLTLVKRLVEMHGGNVEARSEGVGRGAEFVVRLPVMMEVSVPDAETNKPVVSKSSLRILIVDDNRDGADSLAKLLRIMGNETLIAYDGEEGVTVAGRFRPDVVLLDIGLPKLNGYEAARRIRVQPWSKNTVVFAVTGWGQEEDRRRSQEAGFDHHLVKPVDPNTLMKLLAEL